MRSNGTRTAALSAGRSRRPTHKLISALLVFATAMFLAACGSTSASSTSSRVAARTTTAASGPVVNHTEVIAFANSFQNCITGGQTGSSDIRR